MVHFLEREILRPKVLACIDRYLRLSERHRMTVGFYWAGKLYVLGNGSEELALQYDIGSISKTVTAHLILFLCEQGLLNLDTDVGAYLSLEKGSYPNLYDLLTHTAGYGHLTPLEITLPSLVCHGYAKKKRL